MQIEDVTFDSRWGFFVFFLFIHAYEVRFSTVFVFVLVSSVTQKLASNLVEGCSTSRGRTDTMLVPIRTKGRMQDVFYSFFIIARFYDIFIHFQKNI